MLVGKYSNYGIFAIQYTIMKNTIGIIVLCLCLAACNSCKDEEITTAIKRYEVALFNIDTTDFANGVEDIWPEYKIFLGDQLPDERGMTQLKNFVTDTHLIATYQYTMIKFPNLQAVETGLNKGFNIYQSHFPERPKPQVYSYISGYDIQMPVKFADTALIIGLDLYLGKDYEPYREMGYPLYITNRLEPQYILPDCFNEIAWSHITRLSSYTLLDAMIEEGKALYFSEVMLPNAPHHDIIKYSEVQHKWVEQNERNIWSFLIENQLLYSTDAKAITMFMTDGPFTSGFSDEAPARLGHWLGWRIVKAYMENKSVTLPELFENTDSQKILQDSGYKPMKV